MAAAEEEIIFVERNIDLIDWEVVETIRAYKKIGQTTRLAIDVRNSPNSATYDLADVARLPERGDVIMIHGLTGAKKNSYNHQIGTVIGVKHEYLDPRRSGYIVRCDKLQEHKTIDKCAGLLFRDVVILQKKNLWFIQKFEGYVEQPNPLYINDEVVAPLRHPPVAAAAGAGASALPERSFAAAAPAPAARPLASASAASPIQIIANPLASAVRAHPLASRKGGRRRRNKRKTKRRHRK
jgi:hypothetical protein